MTAEQERFWSKVDKTGECWIFTGYCNLDGYGQFRIGSRTDGSRKLVSAHVYAFEDAFGALGDGLCVLHECDNPPCVRPSHLFSGTKLDNSRDMLSKGRARCYGRNQVPPETVDKILALWGEGIPQAEIARAVGIHKQTVWRYVHGF